MTRERSGQSFERLLIANRGEVAVRIMGSAAEMGIHAVAVHSSDDAGSLHVQRADEAYDLGAEGPAAYLDRDRLLAIAKDSRCDAVHPGYGFLGEDARFAQACTDAGVTFVGPNPDVLSLFGDKAAGRALAERCGVPVLAGTGGPTSLAEGMAFLSRLPPGSSVMVKAIAGGGGRGMRTVSSPADLEEAFARCRSEAMNAFGNGDLYVEQARHPARHIEVQIAADSHGGVVDLGERECSVQRRHQKLIEMAPSPWLRQEVRDEIAGAARRMAEEAEVTNLVTFEFLVATDGADHAFIEANPRLQVEHTVTEEVTGLDLVRLQLQLAAGASLDELGLGPDRPAARGVAVQVRVNAETMSADGAVRPSSGIVSAFDAPSGPGVRVDTAARTGAVVTSRFDSLLAKVITRGADLEQAVSRSRRALAELRIDGVPTNAPLLASVLAHPDFAAGQVHTTWLNEHLSDVPTSSGANASPLDDLLPPVGEVEGLQVVRAPMLGTVVSVEVGEGDEVASGQQLIVLEAMKMEHLVTASVSGVVRRVLVGPGSTVAEGDGLVLMEPAAIESVGATTSATVDPGHIRPDLAEVEQRHAVGLDENRPDAVERRRRTGQRTARENVDDLVDDGSFVEYGPVVIAAQRRRRPVQELIERTPADGLIAGIGTVNAGAFGEDRAQCIVMSYDYTVLAGTQGLQNHRKKDRMFELADRWQLPVVFFTEGGGGRPGDTDGTGVSGLDCLAFHLFGRLSGRVPVVAINSGRCFAGNAALLGCCDVVIATEGSNIGMGGPAMIEGGGLGVFAPEDVGPLDVQVANGVVDIAVTDEAEAVAVARQYLSYFQGPIEDWDCADQRLLRSAIPENRLRVYDVRGVINGLADTGSVLELRSGFGLGMVTALARVEGRPLGIVANNPTHLAGAIDSDGADKASRFLQLCDAFGLPVLFLCDTPGIMVGPEAERTALVRHASRMFVTGASLTVPFFTIVLRKGYGLGAQAMAGGSFKAPLFTVAWPTGEFGGMGLEGAVRLGYRNELAAVEDPAERQALFETMVARMYEHGKALNSASHFEIDDVIDPAESRRWIVGALRAAGGPEVGRGGRRPFVDTW